MATDINYERGPTNEDIFINHSSIKYVRSAKLGALSSVTPTKPGLKKVPNTSVATSSNFVKHSRTWHLLILNANTSQILLKYCRCRALRKRRKLCNTSTHNANDLVDDVHNPLQNRLKTAHNVTVVDSVKLKQFHSG